MKEKLSRESVGHRNESKHEKQMQRKGGHNSEAKLLVYIPA